MKFRKAFKNGKFSNYFNHSFSFPNSIDENFILFSIACMQIQLYSIVLVYTSIKVVIIACFNEI